MCAATFESENCIYSNRCIESPDALDVYSIYKSKNIYNSINCNNSTNLFFSEGSDESYNCSFIYNCKNCSNCFLCTNLVNKQFCISNQQYSEEEYKSKVSDYNNIPLKDLLEQYGKLKNDCLKNILSNVNANNCFACSEVTESS